MKIKN